jgi:protein SYS1
MNDFNPKLIFSQIVAIQCFHYLFLGFIFQVNHVFFSTAVTIDRIFTGKYLNLWSIEGWADNAAILFSYIFG